MRLNSGVKLILFFVTYATFGLLRSSAISFGKNGFLGITLSLLVLTGLSTLYQKHYVAGMSTEWGFSGSFLSSI